jgi:hypothetical protein
VSFSMMMDAVNLSDPSKIDTIIIHRLFSFS